MFVYGIGPSTDDVQSCHAQAMEGNRYGLVPVGDVTTYWAFRFEAGSVFPKCSAVAIASAAIWGWVALAGAGTDVSSHTPASAPPVGYPTCAAPDGQDLEPVATPSQYWVGTPLHSSPPVPTPAKKACWRGAMPKGSPEKCWYPSPPVVWVPHCDPQYTM